MSKFSRNFETLNKKLILNLILHIALNVYFFKMFCTALSYEIFLLEKFWQSDC